MEEKNMRATVIFISMCFVLFAQAQKEEWKKTGDGDLRIVYHSNGKISTEILISNKVAYAEQGYAKAWNKKGELIYERVVSRTAMISSVHFSYYENGAVKKAEYSSHPDAGIQWYKEYTTFNEDGTVADVQNWSHDDRVTVVEPREEIYPGKTYKRPDTPKVNSDSLIFYKEYENNPAEASTIEIRKAYPEKGFRETTWYDKGRKTKSITEFFKPSGILYIEKEYYSNGKVKSEKMVEKSVYHFVTYSKSGKVLTKDYNLPLQK